MKASKKKSEQGLQARHYTMIQGHKGSYNPKYYFVWEGFIHLRCEDMQEFVKSDFKCKCVDTLKY